MGDPSGPIEENGGQNGDMDGPSSLVGVGPPSPLTGCYLLIILGEPHSDEHKDIILQRLVKGFLSWDALQTHVDLEEELNTITVHAPEGEDARHGERLIQYASENLVTEILIHPQYNTLIQCMRNLLSSFTRHRHIIHAGYTFSGNESWILQDGTFSVSDFAEAFQEHEVQRVLRAYPNTVSMDIHCDSSSGHGWSVLPDKNYAKTCKIRINPVDVLDSGSDKIKAFIDYLAPMLNPANLNDLLESSDVVGNIRFSHPTLYVFPGGQGDAALFGINGFNMLVDGGFNRKACFWNFARHLDRLDAVLMTRINNSNIQGMSSVIERKYNSHVYPGIGHFFCNIPERRAISSPEENKDKDSLVIDLFDKGQKMISHLKSISLKPQSCYRDIEPMNLYHKVGHGTLDMYVISPGKDSREVKEFIQKWTTNDQKLFSAKDSKDFQFPIQNLVSICALLVWQPANPEDTITRILFPGSTPDYKIIEGLEKIKHLEFMKYPMCTAKKLVPSISTATITKKVLKSAIIEKSIPEPILPSKMTKTEKDNIDNKVKVVQDNKTKESKFIEEQTLEKKVPIKSKPKKIIPKKSDSLDEKHKDDVIENKDKDEESADKPDIMINGNDINETDKKYEIDAKAKPKKFDQKQKIDTKTTIKSRIDSKPPKSMDKKPIKRDSSEKKEVGKSSPTTTPKKTSTDSKLTNGIAKEKEIKPKITSRVSKSSPSSTPAKSTKEANNRKLLESKQKAKTVKREAIKTIEKKEEKIERKPISHRAKGISPSRRPPDSPKKSIKPKTEKDNIIRKAKLDKGGTTDSSLVSTPSADDTLINKKIVEVVSVDEAVTQRELDELKEEQEAVREIEEVFKREEKSKKKDLSSDHREVAKQDSATEAEDDEEYLIIEKEEVEQYTEDSINEQESSMAKEEEMQKHQRRQISEICCHGSLQTTEEEVERKDTIEGKNVLEVEVKHVEIIEPEKDDEDVQPDSIEEEAAGNKMEFAKKEQIKEEVQEIISSAKEIVKVKSDSRKEVAKTEEISSPTPEDKLSSTKKTSDTKDDLDQVQATKDGEIQNLPESQPFSATVESGATTAPTLPEDERIPLDEIKEDLVVEEKYIKEETKETKGTDIPASSVLQKTYEPLERAVPAKMHFDTTQPHLRDIVKTPDEVADLPVHEEADIATYEVSEEAKDDKKSTDRKTVEEEGKHQNEEDITRDSADAENKGKIDKIPNGSVINKEEIGEQLEASDDEDNKEKHIKEDKEEDQAVEALEEKLVFEKTLDKRVDVTGFKEKVSTTAEKVEYAVEDLGKNFENTLKDVTNKDTDKVISERAKEDVTKDDSENIERKEHHEVKKTPEPIEQSKDIQREDDEEEVIALEGKENEPSTVASTSDMLKESNQDLKESEQQDGKQESTVIDDLKDFADKASSLVESISKNITDKVESLVQSTQLIDESQIESKEITVDENKLEFREVFDYSHPYGLKNFPTELRETHITTLDSPIADKDKEKVIDLKILDKLPEDKDEDHEDDSSTKSMTASFHPDDFKYSSFEDTNLKDIKEEEEEDRCSPPNNQLASRKESTEISDITSKDTITVIVVDEHPPRAVSPREEEVLKIVANVAEVLKSEKDIAEIIPDFSEEELERKLRGASPRLDDESGTVQRMLVTASSEDGGEEIVICPEGTIKFSPISTTPELLSGKATPDVTKEASDIKSEYSDTKADNERADLSEKSDEKEEKETSVSSTPEAKTSSVSIDEKEKHELPEKAQILDIRDEKLTEKPCEPIQTIVKSEIETASLVDSASRKESVVSDYIDDLLDRRESGFSAFSEKDITKDESSMDDSRPPSAVSHDLKGEKEDVTVHTLIVDVRDAARPTSAQSAISDQSPEEKSVISKDDRKPKEEEKSPTLSDLKVEVSDERRESGASHISDKSGVEISRPDSIISHFSDKSEPELKEKLGSSPDSITSIDKSMAYMKLTDQILTSKMQSSEIKLQIGVRDTSEKQNEEENTETTKISRPESAASHVSEADKTEEVDTLRAISATSLKSESVEETSKKSVIQMTEAQKNDIPLDGTIGEEKHEPILPYDLSDKDRPDSVPTEKLDPEPKDSRKSSASTVSGFGETKDVQQVEQETTRPDSAKTEKVDEKQKESRPSSVASHDSGLDKTKEIEQDSRPVSVASTKDERETTRPHSVESEKEDEKQKESRTPSVVSHVSDLHETKQDSRPVSVASTKDEKETIRPDSVQSEKEDEKQKKSRAPSVVSHDSDLHETKEIQQDSRPVSVASTKDEKETTRPDSVKSEREDEKQKESRPSSVASHDSRLNKTREIQQDSRPVSVASTKDERETTRPDLVDSEKEDEKQKEYRAPSVVSHVSDLHETKQDSRPVSVASTKDEKETTGPDSVESEKEDEKQKESRAPSVVSHVSDLHETKQDSRPVSVASTQDEKETIRPDSVESEKEDDKQKESRASSVVSHVSDSHETKEIQQDSRPISVASTKDEKETTRPDSAKSDKEDEKQKESRPPSVVSHVTELDETKDIQTDSRPISVASTKNEKEITRPDSVKSEKEDEEQKESRAPSVVSHVSDLHETKQIQQDSRPVSVASTKDEKETTRPDSVKSEKEDEEQKESRAPSVVSHVGDLDETKDIQQDSRPVSVASTKDEKDTTRPDLAKSDKEDEKQQESRTPSVVSHVSDLHETKEIQQDSRPVSAASTKNEKETIRPYSVDSEKEDEKKKESEGISVSDETKDVHQDSRPISVASTKDETETIRPDSAKNEKEDEKQKESRAPSVVSHVSDLDETKPIQQDSRPVSVTSTEDEKETTRPDSAKNKKEDEEQKESRPLSVVSHVSDLDETKDIQQDSRPVSVTSTKDEKETTIPYLAKSEKEDEKQKESRAPSAVSHVSDLNETECIYHDSRPVSVASTKDEKETTRSDSAESEKEDEKQKESRPPSVVSHVSDFNETEGIQHDSRPVSVASIKDERETTRSDSAKSKKVEEKLNQSRPPSVNSRVSDLDETTDIQHDSRPISVASTKDEKEASRPDSVKNEKEDEKQRESRPPSVVSHVSDSHEAKQIQQDSRPSSVASTKDEKEPTRPDSVRSDKEDEKQQESRVPSVVSHVSDLHETKEIQQDSRPVSVASTKDEKETTRPDSVESEKEDEKQEESRAPSVVSLVSDLDETKDIHQDSRPISVASTKDETETTRPTSAKSEKEYEKQKEPRAPSAISHVSDSNETKPIQQDSRPVSVASTKDEKETTRPDSTKSEKEDEKQKESRPPSVVSHISNLDETKDIQQDSRPASVASTKDGKETTIPDSAKSEKEDEKQNESRAPSVVSHVSDLNETESIQRDSRPVSVASAKDEKETTRSDSAKSEKGDEKQKESRPPSAVSHVSDFNETEGIQHDSRPVSVASTKDEKETTRSDSAKSKKVDEKLNESRPPSVNSRVSDLDVTTDIQHDSRPISVASTKDEKEASRPDSIKSEKEDEKQKESRPPSVVSHVSELDETNAIRHDEIQQDSRPVSVASTKDEKETRRPDSARSEKVDEKQNDSRPPSAVSHVSDLDGMKDIQHDSRPVSVASTKDEKEITRPDRPESENKDDKQKESRPLSVTSHVSELDETKDIKHDSRPMSVASTKDEKETAMPESAKSDNVDENQKESRPQSAVSHVSDLDETKDIQQDSRPISVASSKDEKETTRRDSAKSEKVDEKQKEFRPPSVVSHVSDLNETEDIQHDSRPVSVASTKGEKETTRTESAKSDKIDEKKQESRPQSVVSDVTDLVEGIEGIQRDSRPVSVASTKDEKETTPSEAVTHEGLDEEERNCRPSPAVSHVSDDENKELIVSRSESANSKNENLPLEISQPPSPTRHKNQTSRPDSVVSLTEDVPITSDSVVSNKTQPDKQIEDIVSARSESVASNQSETSKRDTRPLSSASQNEDIGDLRISRPESATSHINDKSPASPAKNEGEKTETKQLNIKSVQSEQSKTLESVVSIRAESPGSSNEKLSRPELTASNTSDKLQTPESMHVSEKTSPDKPTAESLPVNQKLKEEICQDNDQQQLSRPPSARPESVASNVGENDIPKKHSEELIDMEKPSQSRPISSQSHVTDKSSSNIDNDFIEKQKDSRSASVVSSSGGGHEKDVHSSRPGSVTSFVSDKEFNQIPSLAASHVSEPKIQSRRESTVERSDVDVDEIEIIKVKDSRSKSVSSIMMTSVYKPEGGFEPMTTFDEGFEQSKDDSFGGGRDSRKASDLVGIVEDVKKIDEKLASAKIDDKFDSTSSISPENEVSDKISTETIHSGRSSPTDSKLTDKISHSMASSSLDAPKTSAESLSGKSTPDVADIETLSKTVTRTEFDEKSSQLDCKTAIVTTKLEKVTKEDDDFDHISKTEEVSKTTEITSEIKSTIKTSSSELHSKSSSISSELQPALKEGATKKDVIMIKSELRSDDDFDLHDANSPRSDISSGHVARVICGWTGSDDEITNSPLSTTSQAPCSPPSKFTYETEYELQRSSSGISKKSEFDIDDSQDDMPPEYGSDEVASAIPIHAAFKSDPMSTSFYGKLPESEPIPITTSIRTVITKQYDECASTGPDSSSYVSQDSKSSSDHRFLDEADIDFENALEQHRQVRGSDVMSSVTSKYEFSPSKQSVESAKVPEFPLSDVQKSKSIESKPDQSTTSQVQTKSEEQIQKEKVEERVSSWGKPLGLPSPVPVESQTTPKRERKLMINKTKINNEKNLRKRSESPIKGKKVSPIYMDLTYVPHNGNSYYSHVEFFKRVRARYYVFSGTEPSRDVYNALLEAKQTWEDKELEVTIIPTYDTDVLGYWVSENEDLLAKYHIDLSPSASRCTINLQDHETSCSAYRLEF